MIAIKHHMQVGHRHALREHSRRRSIAHLHAP